LTDKAAGEEEHEQVDELQEAHGLEGSETLEWRGKHDEEGDCELEDCVIKKAGREVVEAAPTTETPRRRGIFSGSRILFRGLARGRRLGGSSFGDGWAA